LFLLSFHARGFVLVGKIIIIIIIIIITTTTTTTTTSCARGDTICIRFLQVDSIFVFIRQVAPVPAYWLFKISATS